MRGRLTPLFSVFAILAAWAAPAPAADLPAFKRGISMELWTSWPAEAKWANPEKLFPFPEWRRVVTPADLAALKTAGLDFVRLPIDPGVFSQPAPHPSKTG
ncbi:MAG: hypothetical protein HC779_08760 [Phyllobacteriaceae bacterium]|nr:hypothetical protein [Phyllobacteriaceae bacterium]